MRLIELMICTTIIGIIMALAITKGFETKERVEKEILDSYRIYEEKIDNEY